MQASTNDEAFHFYVSHDTAVSSGSYTQKLLFTDIKKRAFDLFIASLVTISILIWLIPLLVILIKWNSPGPALYVQDRTGRNGRKFPCLKFRTMVHENNAAFQQATAGDKRVTRLGRILRKTNLDEMPQFLNVLAGHMSIVGPRPHPIPLDKMHWDTLPGYRERYTVRPGITGLAQARGSRGATDGQYKMRHRVRYDHIYIQNKSTRLDTRICWWTIKAALLGNKNAF